MINSLKKFIFKWSLGWLGIYLICRNATAHGRALDIRVINRLATKYLRRNKRTSISDTFVNSYEKALARTTYWHGTGSLQYRNEKVARSFEELLQAGELIPRHDEFDIVSGHMKSISVSQRRMYSRIYADMHEFGGANPRERHGSTVFWMYFYLVSSALLAISELKLWRNIRKRRQVENRVREKAVSGWATKITRKPYVSWGTFFRNGSDIPDNFGILIGIGDSPLMPTSVSNFVGAYEARFTVPIPVGLWTLIEVPREKIDVAKKLLKDNGYSGIGLFAIEDTEQYWATKQFIDIA